MGCGASQTQSTASAPSARAYNAFPDEPLGAVAAGSHRTTPTQQAHVPKPVNPSGQGSNSSPAKPPLPARTPSAPPVALGSTSGRHAASGTLDRATSAGPDLLPTRDSPALPSSHTNGSQEGLVHGSMAAILQLQVTNLSRASQPSASTASTPLPILSDSPALRTRAPRQSNGLAPVAAAADTDAAAAAAAAAATAAAARYPCKPSSAGSGAGSEASASHPLRNGNALGASTSGPAALTTPLGVSDPSNPSNPSPSSLTASFPDTPGSLESTMRSDADTDDLGLSLHASTHVVLRQLPSQSGGPSTAVGRYRNNSLTDEDDADDPAAVRQPFSLADWRSHYNTNKHNHVQLLEYLWRNFDTSTHSILAATYKEQHKLFAGFQGDNVIHGYCCRLEGGRVDLFGLMHTMASKNTASYKVLGVFIVPSPDIPPQLSSTLDDEHFQLLKADVSDPLVRQFVGQLLLGFSPVPDYVVTGSRLV